ncbi:MAG: DUF1080 domain-containing protein [bacterium]|nr:DUF1080 domain-containing protein [bacterium]
MRNAFVPLVLAGALFLAVVAPALAQDADPVAVLQSDASHWDKSEACRTLQLQGGPEAVPALAALLTDEDMAHMARLALEAMPCAEAGDALRAALDTTTGNLKIGVIGSVAARGDATAVPTFIALLSDADAGIVQAAAHALGQLATPEATQALISAAAKVGDAAGTMQVVCDALLDCAEAAMKNGQPEKAMAVYDYLRTVPKAPVEVRTAALRGAALSRGPKQGTPLLVEALKSGDGLMIDAALRAGREMPGGDTASGALALALAPLPANVKIRLIDVLGARGGEAAGPALLAEAQDGPTDVRVAALKALTRMGYAPALTVMQTLAWGDDEALAKAARQSLSYFPVEGGDAAIESMLASNEAAARMVAVAMIGEGAIDEPAGVLMRAAESDADAGVRVAALKALKGHVGVDDTSRLLAGLLKAPSAEERQVAESALEAICVRAKRGSSTGLEIHKALYGGLPDGKTKDVTEKVREMVANGATSVVGNNANFGDPTPGVQKRFQVEFTANGITATRNVLEGQEVQLTTATAPASIVDAFCGAVDGAKGEAKLAVLRLLGATASPKAFDKVLAAASSSDAAVKETAQRVVCGWPTADALPTVMDLAKSSPNPTVKVLALRGAVRLLKTSEENAGSLLEQYAALMATAGTADEKKAVLSGVAQVPTVAALEMAFAQFGDEAVKAEVLQAATVIAKTLGGSASEDAGFFNGKDMDGWGGETKYWRVKDGALTGHSGKKLPDSTYVWSNVEVADFYLAVDVKLEPVTANSGIQFRSKTINKKKQAFGYQGDIGQNVWGRLYHQGGRGKLDWTDRAEPAVKPGEWNRYEILAVGPAIWTAINGQLGVAYLETDTQDERSGLIALQLHVGPPQTVRYKFQKLVHNPKVEIAGKNADALMAELKTVKK